MAGQPPYYKSPDELETKILEYFNNCPDLKAVKLKDSEGAEYIDYKPCPTVTGLALFLGFCDKQSLYDYQSRSEYSYLIKKARTMIERKHEQNLDNGQCTGAIFALKNMGWKDKPDDDAAVTKLSETIQSLVAGMKSDKEYYTKGDQQAQQGT